MVRKSTYYFKDASFREYVQMNHRHDITDEGITFDYTASTVRFKAKCNGEITIKMRFYQALEMEKILPVAFTVFVDKVRRDEYYCVNNMSDGEIYIFKFNVGEELKSREIEFVRQSEREKANIDLISLEINGELLSTQKHDALVEFIGDSVTCGGANNGGKNGNGRVDDGTFSYAFLTAHTLGLDYRMVSNSGYGLKYGSSGNVGPNKDWIDSYDIQNYRRNTTAPYKHQRNADIVCINLGTNDYHALTHNCGISYTVEEWAGYAKEMIAKAKGYNPDAKVIWIVGGMTRGYGSSVRMAMADLGGEENGYYICDIPDTYHGGGAWHPSVEEHMIMSEMLCDFLKEKNLV